MILWNCEIAQVIRRFNYGSHETRCDVVLDVAMEEPDSGVVGPETPNGRGIFVQHDGVSSDRGSRDILVVDAIPYAAGVWISALEHLVLMAVEMHGVEILMLIIDHKLDYFAIFQDEGVGVDTVDHRVRAVVADCEGSVERGNPLREIGDVVDGETSDTVKGRVVHGHLYASAHGLK